MNENIHKTRKTKRLILYLALLRLVHYQKNGKSHILTFLLLLCTTMAYCQQVSLNVKQEKLVNVLKEIRQQTNYAYVFPAKLITVAQPVTIQVNKTELRDALKQIFRGQSLQYELKDKTIIILERKETIALSVEKQKASEYRGKVVDPEGKPIAGATITVLKDNYTVLTDGEGNFRVRAVIGDDLSIKMLGYQSIELMVSESISLIRLFPQIQQIGEVNAINTGYQSIAKERATGSFSTVNNELLNQQVSTDILSRLPNVANSVLMDKSSQNGQIMVRGISTISGPKDPLIIVDNFPFEGNLNNINPNIVENITILKDASASSIWGARAANGVIVITTKKGQFNSPINIQANSTFTIGGTPNLEYIRQMSSSDFIDVEQELYKKGFYDSRLTSSNKPVVSPVVDFLDKADRGMITHEEANIAINDLRGMDVRDQFDRYMYNGSAKQQYYLSAQGGSAKFSWLSAIGYDHNKETLGETFNRINIRFQNTYMPVKRFTLSTNLYYTENRTFSGRYGYSDFVNLFPYTKMADKTGSPLAVPKNWNQSYVETAGDGKLLDWRYYPLTDWQHQTSNSSTSSLLASAGAKYQIIDGLNTTIDYQFQRESGTNTGLADLDSYMARDYINSFTQIVNNIPVYIVPKGGILDKSSIILTAHNVRGQLSFDKTYGKHNFNAIAGAELRSINNEGNQTKYYGYNPDNLTTGNVDFSKSYPNFITGGSSTILNGNLISQTDRRFVSQYANGAYTFDDKYTISGSLRRDASNLFGLKTNDQWNPFWSMGLAWKLSNEKFYKIDFLPYLNLRTSYGYSGNIDPAMVAVNTIRFLPRPSVYTGTSVALFENYYNPKLKWETSKMLNIALDFKTKSNRISGSFEFFHKKGINLFGTSQIDYTTGVSPYMLRNVASMKGSGLDIELKMLNINRKFKWSTILNFSSYKDKIAEYNVDRSLSAFYISTDVPPISGVKDHPVYAMYAYKWAGLDPENGEPRGYLNGEISKDYTSIIGEGTSIEDLKFFGSAIPNKFGSLINSFAYQSLSLQIGISYKFGYWFRRSSINYTELFNNWRGHSDFSQRWQNPGDELNTNIPSIDYQSNSSRDQFFEGSSVLVERGDHIRLQYLNLAYSFKNLRYFKSLQLYLNANNLGILWKANKAGIDPDFNINLNRYVTPANYSIGFRAQF